MLVVNMVLEDEELTQTVHSRLFIPTFRKRSINTPANEKPIAEQVEIENSSKNDDLKQEEDEEKEQKKVKENQAHGEAVSSARTDCKQSRQATDGPQASAAKNTFYDMSSNEKDVYEKIGNRPLDFSTLAAVINLPTAKLSSILIMLELKGLIENGPGEFYVRSLPQNPPSKARPELSTIFGPSAEIPKTCERKSSWSGVWNSKGVQNFSTDSITAEENTLENAAINFIIKCYKGVSRKYLQVFLAEYWCHCDRTHWSKRSLLKTCAKARPIREVDVRAFRSPLFVKLAIPRESGVSGGNSQEHTAA